VEGTSQAYGEIGTRVKRDELILAHLPLVRHLIGKLTAQLPSHIDVENLESAGVLGLVEAASHFDPARGVQFKTFAYARVRGAILDELRRNSSLPQQVIQRLAKVRQAYEDLNAPVTVEGLASAAGLTVDEVADTLAVNRMSRLVSLHRSTEPTITTRLDEREAAPDAQAERSEQAALLTDGMASLPERERLVLTLYYMEDLRLKEIAKSLNLSESRVSRVLNAALFHLGEFMRSKGW
jgi:RNA polymerase sigma factor FliA